MTVQQINDLARDIAELLNEQYIDYQYDAMVDDLCALFEQNEYAALVCIVCLFGVIFLPSLFSWGVQNQ